MSNQSCSLVVGNREKFAFEGCLFAFDKFSADNTKKFRSVIDVMMAVR